MKKAFRYLFAMAFAVVGLVAWASGSLISGFNAVNDETTPDYSTHYDGQSLTRADRNLNSVQLQANGELQTIETGQNTSNRQIVCDRTDQTFTCKAGEELTATVNYEGGWMHCFVYIDENKDGFIYNGVEDYLDGHTLKVGADIDLKTFSWFEDYDSKGTYLGTANNAHNTLVMPSFKAPETPGTYRMRYKVDWSWLNPKGRLSEDRNTGSNDDNNTKQNGGCICDVTLVVEAVTGLSVSATELFLGAGETSHVAATAPNAVTYTSSRPDLVSVNEDGELTALASTEGKVDVTITVVSGAEQVLVTVHYDSYGTSISSGSEPSNERYLTTVTTTGATENLNYTEGTYPGATHYVYATGQNLKVEAGQEISLTFAGSGGTDGFLHTYGKAWADWDGNSVFDETDELVFEAGTDHGSTADFLTGHSVTFTVPETVTPGASRLRMVFVDAWDDGLATLHPTGATHRGFTIDFDLEIAAASTPGNPAIVVEGNLFQNSSLEDWTGTKPDHWATLSTNNGTISQVEDAHSGQYALSLGKPTASSAKRFGGEALDLTAGTYTFSAYVKLPADATGAENANKIRLGYAPVVNGVVQSAYVYQKENNDYVDRCLTAEWQQFSWTFELAEDKTVSFYVAAVRGNPDAILIDDLCLTKDAEPTQPEVTYPEDPEGGQKIDFSWGADKGLYNFGTMWYWTNNFDNDTENLTAVNPTVADGVLTAKVNDTLSLFTKEKCIYKVIYTIVDTENYSKPVASHGTLVEDLDNHKLIWTIEEGDDLTVDVQKAMKITATGALTLAYMTYYTRDLVTPAVPTQPEVEGDALEYVYFKQGDKYLGITAISGNNGVNKVDEPQTWQVIPQTDGSVQLKDLEGANVSGQNYLYDGSTFSINDLTAAVAKLNMQLYLIDTATGIGYPVSELHAGSTYAIYGKNLNKALDNTIVSKGSGSGQYNYFNGVAPTTQGENKVFPETTWWTVEAGVEPAPAEPTPEYYVFNEYTFKYLGTDENNVNVLDEPANVAFAANEENHTVTMDFVNPTNATQHGMHIGSGCRFSVGTAADAQFYIYEIGEEGIGTLVETVEAGKTYGFVAKKSNTEIAALTSNVYSAGNSSQRLEGEILEETDGFPATTMMFSAAAQWTVYATDATLPEPPSFPETVYNVVTNRKTGKLLVANTETNTLELTDDATAATKFGVEWTYAEGRNHSYLRTEAGKYVALVEAGEGYAFTLSDTPAEASVLEESETRFVVYFPVSEYIEMLLGVADDAVVATDDWDGAIYWAWGEYVATPTTPPTVATVDPEEGEVESLDHIRLTFDELAFDLYQNLDDMTLRPVLTRNGEVVPTHSNFNNPPVWVEGAEGEEGYWNYDSDAAEEGVYHVVLREATTAPGTYVLTIPAGAVVYYDDDAEEVGNEEVSFTWTIAGDEPVVADYSTNWDGQNADHDERYTTAVGITTASNDAQQTTSTLQPRDFQALVWNLADADEPMVFTAQQNEMITPFFNFNGKWMHGYVWVDEDGDGFSCVADNETHTITGDLKSYNFYSFSDSDESGYNSLGEAVTGDARNCLNSSNHGAPAFAAPAQVGDYRIRFIVDWNCIDPKGAPEGYATGSTKRNGGIIVDAILRVSPVTGINAATIDFENQKVFDLQGRRVLKPTHGVFIVNGKKIMVK